MRAVTSWFLQKPRGTPRLPGVLEVGLREGGFLLITTTSSRAPASSVLGAKTPTRGFSEAASVADDTIGAGIVVGGTIGAGEMMSGTSGAMETVEGEAASPVLVAPTPLRSIPTFTSSVFCSMLPFITVLLDALLEGAVFAGVACKRQFVSQSSHHHSRLSKHQALLWFIRPTERLSENVSDMQY